MQLNVYVMLNMNESALDQYLQLDSGAMGIASSMGCECGKRNTCIANLPWQYQSSMRNELDTLANNIII